MIEETIKINDDNDDVHYNIKMMNERYFHHHPVAMLTDERRFTYSYCLIIIRKDFFPRL